MILVMLAVTAALVMRRHLHRATGLPGTPRIGDRVAGSVGWAAG
ncbi:MAG: hypothetical protein M0031_14820 [Thermaerobacter sp.]|nr:hypothetical protein [Thermaerobacter sp.]